MAETIVKRVDHLIVRVPNPDPLFTLFTRGLFLPAAWPSTTNAIYASAGIFLGNINLDIRQFRRTPGSLKGPAHLYGIAFEMEPFDRSLPALAERDIPHTPPMPFIQVDDQGWQVTTWTMVFLGGLLGDSPARRMLFNLSHRAPRETWEHGSLPGLAKNPLGLPYIFNRVFPNTVAYGIEYNPAWRAANIREEANHTGLDMLRVFELTVGTRDMQTTGACWKSLLEGYPQIDDAVWQLPGDLHIRLVPHERNELIGMIWQVASINRAAQFLYRQGLLAQENGGEVSIHPEALQGLSIRLMA